MSLYLASFNLSFYCHAKGSHRTTAFKYFTPIWFRQPFFFEKPSLYFICISDGLHSKSYKDIPKKQKLHPNPCKKLPIFLITDGRSSRNEAGHLPDAGMSKFLSGRSSRRSEALTCVVVAERQGFAWWLVAISSPEVEGSDSSTRNHLAPPNNNTPIREK